MRAAIRAGIDLNAVGGDQGAADGDERVEDDIGARGAGSESKAGAQGGFREAAEGKASDAGEGKGPETDEVAAAPAEPEEGKSAPAKRAEASQGLSDAQRKKLKRKQKPAWAYTEEAKVRVGGWAGWGGGRPDAMRAGGWGWQQVGRH